MQTGTAAEPARLALREGTWSQICPDQINQPRGCMSSSPSRRDRAWGLLRFHDAGGRGDILTRRLCVLGGGLVPGGDATPFAQDRSPCSGGANASASSPAVRKSRGNLPPSHISSRSRARTSRKPDLQPRLLCLPQTHPLHLSALPAQAADAIRLRSTWGSRALLLAGASAARPGSRPAQGEFWQWGQRRRYLPKELLFLSPRL